MFLIDHPTAVPAMPLPGAPGAPGWFTGGSPAGGEPATVVTADFLNILQAEIVAVLTDAGIAPVKATTTQLRDSIRAIAAARASGGAAGPKGDPGANGMPGAAGPAGPPPPLTQLLDTTNQALPAAATTVQTGGFSLTSNQALIETTVGVQNGTATTMAVTFSLYTQAPAGPRVLFSTGTVHVQPGGDQIAIRGGLGAQGATSAAPVNLTLIVELTPAVVGLTKSTVYSSILGCS